MKKCKLILFLCLLFVLSLTIVACGADAVTTADTQQDTTPVITTTANAAESTTAVTTSVTTAPITTAAVTTEAPKQFASLKIGETPISEYTIVYARSKYAGYIKMPNMKAFFPIYDFDRESAERLSDIIFELSGVRLKVAEDQSRVAGDNEILIGKTNRINAVNTSTLSLGSLATDDYLIDVEDTKLVICGGAYGTTWHALDYLESYLASLLEGDTADYAFASDYTYQGAYHLVQIGCIGDSITQGSNASSSHLTYPEQLGRILWKDAIVTNYGSSGSTMRNDLAAYTQRDVYNQARAAASKTDLFIVMLGTNDSFYDGSWTDADSKKFNEDCLGIFQALKAKNQNLQFVLANCPRYFGTGGWASVTVRGLQRNLVPTLNDAGYPTTFYDMFTATSQMSQYFPDQLHPDNEGSMIMAQKFATFLQPLVESLQK